MGNVNFKELLRKNKKLSNANWITVLRIIGQLDVFTIERYRDEIQFEEFLRKITDDRGFYFYHLLESINILHESIALELIDLFKEEITNDYLKEIMKAIRLRSESQEVQVSGLDNVFISFASLGMVLFREFRFALPSDQEGFDVIWDALKEDNAHLIKAFITNGEFNLDARTYTNESLMHLAAHENAVEVLQLFIDYGLDMDWVSDEGLTPLLKALYSKSFKAARLLIELGADINHQDLNGNSPLHVACYHQEMEIVKLLIDHHANYDSMNKNNENPLSIAIMVDHVELIDYLLKNGARLKPVKDRVYFWIASNNSMNAYSYFMEKGINTFNSLNERRYSPLHVAAENNSYDIAKRLVEDGAKVNAWGKQLLTPLHFAAMKNSIDIAKLLLEHQAEVDAKDDEGLTPLHLAVQNENVEMVNLLIENKADIAVKSDQGITPFYYAVVTGNVALSELFITLGEDVNTVLETIGTTPLHEACSRGDLSMAELLIKHGANVNTLSKRGISPLYNAVVKNHYKIVRLLVKHGAMVDHVGKNIETPLQVAFDSGFNRIKELLIVNGANQENLIPTLEDNYREEDKKFYYCYLVGLIIGIVVFICTVFLLVFQIYMSM